MPRLTAEVLLEQRRPAGRVQGHRHASGEEHAEKGVEVVQMSGQHERNGVTGRNPLIAKATRHVAARRCELAEGPFEQRGGVGQVEQPDVRPVGLVLGMPGEGVEERVRPDGHLAVVPRSPRRRRLGEGSFDRQLPAGCPHGPDPLLGRRRLREDLVFERDPEGLLHACSELYEREAVDAEIGIEPALQPDR